MTTWLDSDFRYQFPETHRGLVLSSPPDLEPISAGQVNAWAKIDTDADNARIDGLIIPAVRSIGERAILKQSLITQTWTLWLDVWPAQDFTELPMGPVQVLNFVKLHQQPGTDPVILCAPNFYLFNENSKSYLYRADGGIRPVPGRTQRGIEINYDCGFGDAASDVPASIRSWLVAWSAKVWEENVPPDTRPGSFPPPPWEHVPVSLI